jgi:hypothetical protein
MKLKIILACLLFSSYTAFASGPSLLGGSKMSSDTAHQVGVGWPSLFYEWWHDGTPDWAIGGELVYGDWSGEFSDVEVGFAFNMPFRWQLQESGNADIAMQLKPGALIGMGEGPAEPFVFGLRGEFSVPIKIDLDPMVNLITGGAAPVSVMFIEDLDPFVVIPLMGRIGAEVKVNEMVLPWILLELGPALAFGDFGAEIEFAFRIWIGSTFW